MFLEALGLPREVTFSLGPAEGFRFRALMDKKKRLFLSQLHLPEVQGVRAEFCY